MRYIFTGCKLVEMSTLYNQCRKGKFLEVKDRFVQRAEKKGEHHRTGAEEGNIIVGRT